MQKNTTKTKKVYRQIYRDVFTIDDKIKEITKLLVTRQTFYFEELFKDSIDKYEIIVTFLATLEMVKRKLVIVEQEINFDKILIKRRKINS